MIMRNTHKLLAFLSLSLSSTLWASSLTLSSHDIQQGQLMSTAQAYNGFGCTGDDLSPHLIWSNAPQTTKSFAITAYDPDAPTGSGWWHWQLINIPVHIREVSTGAGSTVRVANPAGSIQMKNDYGSRGFGGACPPIGHGIHHYQFTVHALSVENIELPADASAALTGYMINAHSIESATIESLYQRE